MSRIAFALLVLGLVGAGCSFSGAKRAANQAVNTAQQTGDIVSGAADLAIKAKADLDLATAQAHDAYNRAVADERSLSNGPCLADPIGALPDWVVDVVHTPRTAVDDEPSNQCTAFREGRAHHFIELDLTGRVVRAL